MVWVAFALMSTAVALCLVWPLAAARSARGGKAADLDFYKSQLAEVDSDVGRGILGTAEAEATRAEISRRLLAAAGRPDAAPQSGFRTRRIAAVVAAVVLVPLVAIGLYLHVGDPGQPDLPLAARNDGGGLDFAAALAKIEAHLASDPNDGRGFQLIAPIYVRMGRFDDATRAYEATLRLLGETAERRAALGQALVMAADGVVTADARADFDKALAEDPKLPQARFFQAVAAEQDGDAAKARTLWQDLAADTPAGAPWLAAVQQHLAGLNAPPGTARPPVAEVDGSAPPLAGHATAAAGIAAMAPGQQATAIRGMVEGLAARLAQNGRDPEGWLRLIKAYTVLGDDQKARTALAAARKGLDGDTASLDRVEALARQLGLEG